MHLSVCDRRLLGGVLYKRQVELADGVGQVFYSVSDFLPTVLLLTERGMLKSLTVIKSIYFLLIVLSLFVIYILTLY